LDNEILFSPLGIEDKALYDSYYDRTGTRISDLNFVSRMAWWAAFNYEKAVIDNTFVVLSPRSVFSDLHFSVPLGLTSAAHLEGIIDKLWPQYADRFAEATGQQPHLRFLYLEKEELRFFNFLDRYHTHCLMKPAFSDYVYNGSDLATLKGKFYNGKRNHLNKFMRAYPDFEYRSLQKQDAAACLTLTEEWVEERGVARDDLLESDYIPIQALFRYFDELELFGGTLWVGGRLIAFSILSKGSKDTVIVHIEKALSRYRGAYTAINKFTIQNECPDILWVNREEDMGIEGLHKAKQSYGPAYMVDKYEVSLTRKV
jgi:hypothetical protein